VSTRDGAIRELLARALTRPTNLLVGAAIAAAGIITGFWPLVPIGVAVYGVLAATTFFSVDEAKKVLADRRRPAVAAPPPPPPARFQDRTVAARFDQAVREEGLITEALGASPLPLPEVEVEIVGLMDDVRRLCRRADAISVYLGTVDEARLQAERDRVARQLEGAPPDLVPTLTETRTALDQQIGLADEMHGHLQRFDVQMDQLVHSLAATRGQIVRLAVASEPDASARVLDQLTTARGLVSGVADGIEEAEARAARPLPRAAGDG
jgi:hypothetical protein